MIKQNISRFLPSRLLRFCWMAGVFYLVLLTLLRLVFHFIFTPAGEQGLFRSFLLGFRYDARIVGVFLLIILLLGTLPFFKPFTNKISRRILFAFIHVFNFLLLFFYTVDFAHFAYLRQRLNASVLSYMDDAGISLSMVWESYPVIKIFLGWMVMFVALFFALRFLYRLSGKSIPAIVKRRTVVIHYVISFFIFAFIIWGRIGQYPLRWGDAYNSGSDYRANLSLTPFQSFFSSLKFRNSSFDEKQTKKYFPLIASQLGITNADTSLNFERVLNVKDSLAARRPNIVLVICESFSAYKSSMWGNPLNTTPYFNELCRKGVFFDNCFSPAYGTAKGIWAIMTGIPDVSEVKTASRNIRMVDQQTIMNQFDGYSKHYFIGGSASWANIRGLLTGNINGLQLYEEEDYSSPSLNVWGISDKDLFLEANEVLKKQQDQPFFAIIQTADNHRPYTIPDEDKPFITLRNFPKDSLEKNGFWTNEELNAYAYMDYTYKVFLETAGKEKYFDNTIFVFVGDHGIRGNAGDLFPRVWTDQGLTCQHVPLLFYAPSMFQPAVISKKVSQIDIMPTLAALCGEQVTYAGLGKNIFENDSSRDDHAFVLDSDLGNIGLVTENYFFKYNRKTKEEGVYSLLHNNPLQKEEPGDSLLNQMRNLTLGYYEASRYLLFNNKKKQ